MQDLLKLTNWINQYNLGAIRVLGQEDGTSIDQLTQVDKLYHLIANEEVTTDDEAALALGFEGKHIGNYRRVKTTLKQRLYPLFFFGEMTNEASFEYEWQYYVKKWAQIEILDQQGLIEEAKNVADSIHALTAKYILPEIRLKLVRFLRKYSALHNDVEKYHEYNSLFKKTLQEKKLKDLADEYKNQAALLYKNRAPIKQKVREIDSFLKELSPYFQKYNNLFFYINVCSIQIIRASILKDYNSMLTFTTEQLLCRKEKENNHKSIYIILLSNKLISLLQLKKYPESLNTALELKKYSNRNSRNWFVSLGLIFKLSIYIKNYKEARRTISIATQGKYFYSIDVQAQEIWEVYNAYLSYIEISHQYFLDKKTSIQTFKISRFLNSVPTLSKDKTGFNITILIIHFAFLLQQHRYNRVIDRAEALAKYIDRYTSTKENYRSRCFVKMLLAIVKADFDKAQTIASTAHLVEELKKRPLDMANQKYQTEIIPYEDFWELVVKQLK